MCREKQLTTEQEQPFMDKFHGKLIGILRWPQLDELWQVIRTSPHHDWYIYHIGDIPPQNVCSAEKLSHFIQEIDLLLKQDHEHDYCGIVYADNKNNPTFVKIYDPNNLGHVCGSNGAPPPLPGWILSKTQPVDLEVSMAPTGSRKRWWQKIFS